MHNDPLSRGREHPASLRHLEQCDACLDARLRESLERPAEVAVPPHFRARVLASLPAATPPARSCWDVWPEVAAACSPALLGAVLWWSGSLPGLPEAIPRALQHPAVLATAGALEMALALLWAVRSEASEQ